MSLGNDVHAKLSNLMILSVLAALTTATPCCAGGASQPDTIVGARAIVEVDLATGWQDQEQKIARADHEKRKEDLMEQSVEVMQRRIIDLTGIQPSIRRLPGNRIQIDIPGLSDMTKLREYFAPPEKLTLHLVNETVPQADIRDGQVPPDTMILDQLEKPDQSELPIAVYKKPILSGDRIADARNALNEMTMEPIVNIRLDELGTREVAKITRDNVGHRIALVLGGKVLSAPMVREPITGGSMEISGNFTSDEAAKLAVLLRAGATPAPFKLLELRLVDLPR